MRHLPTPLPLVLSFLALACFGCGGSNEAPAPSPHPSTTTTTPPTEPSTTEPSTTPTEPRTQPTATTPTGDTGPVLSEETFTAAPPASHDILFVVDDSRSMVDYQLSIGNKVHDLIDPLNARSLDWRIGVTSTDIEAGGACAGSSPGLAGRLVELGSTLYFDSATPDPDGQFSGRVELGSNGASCPKGLGAAFKAIDELGATFNAPFVRTDAALHIVVLSVEKDHTDQDTPPVITVADFIDWLEGLADAREVVSFSPIVCTSPASCDINEVGVNYLDVSASVGGATVEVNGPTFSKALNDVSTHIMSQASGRFVLVDAPDAATLEVEVDGVLRAASEVELVDRTVTLDPIPAVGAVVVIRYLPL